MPAEDADDTMYTFYSASRAVSLEWASGRVAEPRSPTVVHGDSKYLVLIFSPIQRASSEELGLSRSDLEELIAGGRWRKNRGAPMDSVSRNSLVQGTIAPHDECFL